MKNKLRRSSITIVGLMMSILFAQKSAIAQDWQSGAGDDWNRVLAAARQEGKVVVGSDTPSLASSMPAAFKRDTGIEMEFFSGGTGVLLPRLEREVQTGNITIDATVGGATRIKLAEAGAFLPIKPLWLLPTVTDPKNWIGGETRWLDKENNYLFEGSNYVHGWVIVNPTSPNAKALSSWKQLLRPEFKGKIASHDPSSGGPGRAVAAYIIETFGIDFFKQLYVGQQVALTRDPRQLVEWVARGTYSIGLAANQNQVESFKSQGLSIEVPEMTDGPGYLIGGFSLMAVLKGAPHPNAAQVFANWYASKLGQEAYSREMLEASTRTDVKLSSALDYIVPKPGIKYLDEYEYSWYSNSQSKLVAQANEALGGR